METQRHKILIVDSSPANIKLLMAHIKETYVITAATTGEKAIELAKNIMPNIIFMATSMPSMNGYETCRIILKNQDARIIFLSDEDVTAELMCAIEAGGIDYIVRPLIPDILHEKIKKALLLTHKNNSNAGNKMIQDQSENFDLVRMLLDFTKASIESPTNITLTHLILEFTQLFSFECAVQLHTSNGIINASTQGNVTELEAELRLVSYKNMVTYSNNKKDFLSPMKT